MLKKTLASLVLATSLLACKQAAPQIIALPSSAAEVIRPGQMTVTGTATLEVSPDCADLTMTISADGAKPGQATAAVQVKQQALVAALMKLGIESADLKLSYLTLNPIYVENRDGAQLRVATYRAEVTVTATTRHFDKIGSIMDTGAQSGASSMSSQFRRSDLSELKMKVRDMALTAAKNKASQTAKSLGIELGRVVSVVEAPAGQMWATQYFPNMAMVERGATPNPVVTLGGALQPLTLDITIGFELSKSA